MPPVIKVGDQDTLVETSKFPHAKWSFDKFNPVQSRAFEYYDKDNNFIAACLTSSGKTILAELFLSYDIRKNKKKGIYLVPYKSLAQERVNDWTSDNHHFHDLNISVCTGDYRLTSERKKELDNADLIIMSYEMYNSRVRNLGTERSNFLLEAGTLVCDEFHSIGIKGRGDHIESALMKFTNFNKSCRLVMLSATVPNVDELSNWISFILNSKDTILLKSDFRPCPLFYHYEKYYDGERTYEENEQQKVSSALQIVEYYPNDKFLIFTHTKKTGLLMKQALSNVGIKSEFHNADLNTVNRQKIEKQFKESDLRVVVATSTLAAGINMPARRVIILGIHRGLEEVERFDLHQECVSVDSNIMIGDNVLFKKAKDIVVGDKVKGIKDNLITFGEVKKVIKSYGQLRHFSLNNGTKISLSNHPVMLWDGSWVSSDNLKVSDKVCVVKKSNFNGGIDLIKNSRPTKGDMFYSKIKDIKQDDFESELLNFQVSNCNTFIVDDVVTHNCGRAGRPLYDPVGDAYILLPERTYDLHKERIKRPQLILSQMLDQEGGHNKVLAFHLVSEIYQESIKSREDVHHWYQRSLAHFQSNELDATTVDSVLDLLKKCGAIWEEDGVLTVTSVGKISSLFYYSPFDVSDLKKNFTQLFEGGKENDDFQIVLALGNIDTHRYGIVSKAEREDMSIFANTVSTKMGKATIKDSAVKVSYVYHQMLSGTINPVFASMTRALQFDFARLNQVLQSIDGFTGRWDKKQWLSELQLRMSYGVQSKYIDLCKIEGVGKVRAKKLYDAGLKSLKDIINNKSVVKKALNCSNEIAQKIYENAKNIL